MQCKNDVQIKESTIFVTQTNQGGAMHYTLKDHQGSLTATVCGNTVERLSYDAWGRRPAEKWLEHLLQEEWDEKTRQDDHSLPFPC